MIPIINRALDGDLLTDCLAVIAAENDRLRAMVDVDCDAAYADAARSEERWRQGKPYGPLDGIPVVIKDNIDVAGFATLAGSLAREKIKVTRDATCVSRLRSAGAIIVGKSAMSEFGMEPYGSNHWSGTVRNYWDDENFRLPGGSSSGSAVAVASGMAFGSLGTDTGGSTRLPAGWNGVVGLRPTPGTVPSDGVVPLSQTLDVVGPIASSVDIAGLVFDAISDGDAYFLSQKMDCSAWVVAKLHERELDDVHPDIRHAYDDCLEKLQNADHSVQELSERSNYRESAQKSGFISTTEGYYYHGHLLAGNRDLLDPLVASRLESALDIRAVDYCDAVFSRLAKQFSHLEHWNGADCLLTPVSVSSAPIFEGLPPKTSPSTFLRPVGYLGLCSIVLPIGRDQKGMPIGVQVIGRPNEESKIFAMARLIEDLFA